MRSVKGTIKTALPCLLLLTGAGYGLNVYQGYEKGQQEYNELRDEYTTPFDEESKAVVELGALEEENSSQLEEFKLQEKRVWRPIERRIPDDAPEKITVQWDELLEKNRDVVAWIYIPSLTISYPVLQAEDNEYYLHRDINREYLYAGSIFMDAYNSPHFFNYNTIIYGHNMRDGSMFAKLSELMDADILQNCHYFWLLTPESDLLYEICSIHNAVEGSDTFILHFADVKEYSDWQRKMLSLSAVSTEVTLDTEDRIITLSTCTQNRGVRMIVQGRLLCKE